VLNGIFKGSKYMQGLAKEGSINLQNGIKVLVTEG